MNDPSTPADTHLSNARDVCDAVSGVDTTRQNDDAHPEDRVRPAVLADKPANADTKEHVIQGELVNPITGEGDENSGAPTSQKNSVIGARNVSPQASTDRPEPAEGTVGYSDIVGIRFLTAAGHLDEAKVFKSCAISPVSLVIVSRKFIAPATEGVLQLVRSDGRLAVVGVSITDCCYTGKPESGNPRHEVYLEFTAVPEQITVNDLLDDQGRLELFDPMLQNNVRSVAS